MRGRYAARPRRQPECPVTQSPQHRSRLRRSFDRAAAGFDAAAVLPREIAQRMEERLALMRMPVRDILDAGCGTGFGANLLRQRYASAQIVELDLSEAMLSRRSVARKRAWLWPRRSIQRLAVCADLQQMPLAASSFDLVWSNLALHWADELAGALAQMHRVLRPGGLLMFSLFGPDTLKELRAASNDTVFQVNQQVDMHDIGDALIQCGFADPVMDMEIVTLTYADVPALLHDLQAQGSINLARSPRKGLGGRRGYQEVLSRYERFRRPDRSLPATCEIVYGHAWRAQPRVSPKGGRVIDIRSAHG
jgi:malonyl-CoA O-methyltransferase